MKASLNSLSGLLLSVTLFAWSPFACLAQKESAPVGSFTFVEDETLSCIAGWEVPVFVQVTDTDMEAISPGFLLSDYWGTGDSRPSYVRVRRGVDMESIAKPSFDDNNREFVEKAIQDQQFWKQFSINFRIELDGCFSPFGLRPIESRWRVWASNDRFAFDETGKFLRHERSGWFPSTPDAVQFSYSQGETQSGIGRNGRQVTNYKQPSIVYQVGILPISVSDKLGFNRSETRLLSFRAGFTLKPASEMHQTIHPEVTQ